MAKKFELSFELPKKFFVAVIRTEEGFTIHYKEYKKLSMGYNDTSETLWECLNKDIALMIEKAIKHKGKWVIMYKKGA